MRTINMYCILRLLLRSPNVVPALCAYSVIRFVVTLRIFWGKFSHSMVSRVRFSIFIPFLCAKGKPQRLSNCLIFIVNIMGHKRKSSSENTEERLTKKLKRLKGGNCRITKEKFDNYIRNVSLTSMLLQLLSPPSPSSRRMRAHHGK